VAREAVMVAGGAGFIGSAVVRELLAQDETVVSFDNYLHGTPENLKDLSGRLEVVFGDALDEMSLNECILKRNVRYIIDCIGDTFVPTAYLTPRRFLDINLYTTLNILRAAALHEVSRILYVSSTEVYGRNDDDRLDEAAPLAPVNTYAVSKLAADRLCYTFSVEHAVPVVIARIFNCYGPRESQPYIIPDIIYQLYRSNTLFLGNVRAERDFTYVDDMARALIALLRAPINPGEVVNVGSDTSYRIDWLAEKIATIMGKSGVELELDPKRLRRMDIDRFRCNNGKLTTLTGWRPEISIDDGLSRTVNWFRDNGNRWSWNAFVDGTLIYR
jgi:nucleoside-diphosphate-sugar epimerase